nr:zf-CCHC domain-containing protein/UBN2 domain-containing protein [Tanacetum cinerariifolium]
MKRAIKESKDLSSLALDELIAKKYSSDDETSTSGSVDEEYAMIVRNFKKFFERKGKFVRQPHEEKKSFWKRDDKKGNSDRKCFRCGDLNHPIGECPKPPRNKDQKLFVGVVGALAKMKSRTKPTMKHISWLNRKMSVGHICDNMCKVLFTEDGSEIIKDDKIIGYSQNNKAFIILNEHTMKVEESLNVTFDESPPPTKLSPLVDDDVDKEEAIEK